MRVLHVSAGNLFGGIESMLLAFAEVSREQSGLQHSFALCFDERLATELRALGQPVHLLGPVRMSRPVSAHTARRRLQALLNEGFDVVICHAPWSQAIFGGVIRRRGVPLAFWAHDRITGRHWTERLARLVPPDLVIANSAFTETTRATMYPTVRSAVLHPAARFRDPNRERRFVRMSLDTPQDAVVILQASRCEPWKGHRLLLDALTTMRDVPGWVWWVAGGAQRPHEVAYLTELRDAAASAGIEDRVRWLGHRGDVATLMGAADLYCQANKEPEPFGLAFVEALAAGLPVVSVRHGGVCEIVDETCGVLVPPDDVTALARTLSQLVSSPDARGALGAGAPARARQLAHPLSQSHRLKETLGLLVAGRAGAGPWEMAG